MRTTLTLDDDVAAALARRQQARRTGLKQEVNDLLRAGLAAEEHGAPTAAAAYVVPTHASGRMLIADLAQLSASLGEEDDERTLRHVR